MDPLDKSKLRLVDRDYATQPTFTTRKIAKECEILMQLSFATMAFNDSGSREYFFIFV